MGKEDLPMIVRPANRRRRKRRLNILAVTSASEIFDMLG